VTAVLAVLADKDAAAIVAALAPALRRAVCTGLPGRRRAFGADELVGLCEGAGVEAEAAADVGSALARGRELAYGEGGALLVTGSHYVLAPARAALGLGAG
jgi:dihydrofolate synthase/folylpolyglutamate synthase